jgi:hypothetical protein
VSEPLVIVGNGMAAARLVDELTAPLRLNVPGADLRANCSIPQSPSQAQGAASLEFPPTFSAPHRRGDRIGGLLPVMALKRPTVAPTEGLLTEAVLKLACVVRTAARDPERTGYGSISRSVGSGSAPAAVSIAWT